MRSLRVIAVLIFAGLLVAFGVSTHRPNIIVRPAIQPPSKSAGGQPEAEQPCETVGDVFDPRSQETELGRVAILAQASAMPSAVEPASQSLDGQLEAQRPGEMSGEDFDEHAQQTKLTKIHSGTTNQATLQYYLRDADPIVGASAFSALGVRDKQAAVDALLDVVNDPTEPVRLQALQILLASSDIDQATLDLRAAFNDVDPAFVACAAQELGARDDGEALNTLAEVLGAGDPPTRLLIVQSIANNTSAAPLLYQSLNDPDESVRNAARAILFPPK